MLESYVVGEKSGLDERDLGFDFCFLEYKSVSQLDGPSDAWKGTERKEGDKQKGTRLYDLWNQQQYARKAV